MAVVHPTHDFNNDTKGAMKCCITVTILILFSLAGIVFFVLFARRNDCVGYLNEGSLLRVGIESVFCFFIPASLSGYLYWKVIEKLKESPKNEERNRMLSIAFRLSWALWILCWTPKYVLSAARMIYDATDSVLADKKPTWLYVELFRLPVQMLYSQLNPFLYIMIFKRPAEFVADRLAAIRKTFLVLTCFRKSQISDPNEAKTSRKNLRYAEVFLAAMTIFVLTTSLFWVVKPYIGFGSQEVPKFRLEKSRREIAALRGWNAEVNVGIKDVVDFVEPRQKCWELQGSLRMDFRRCFKLINNFPTIPYYEEQIENCETMKMDLVYPRSYDEMIFIANLLNTGTFGFIKDMLLCGLEQINQSETSSTYRSLDGKFTEKSPNEKWFVDYSREDLTLRGHPVFIQKNNISPFRIVELGTLTFPIQTLHTVCFYDF